MLGHNLGDASYKGKNVKMLMEDQPQSSGLQQELPGSPGSCKLPQMLYT